MLDLTNLRPLCLLENSDPVFCKYWLHTRCFQVRSQTEVAQATHFQYYMDVCMWYFAFTVKSCKCTETTSLFYLKWQDNSYCSLSWFWQTQAESQAHVQDIHHIECLNMGKISPAVDSVSILTTAINCGPSKPSWGWQVISYNFNHPTSI